MSYASSRGWPVRTSCRAVSTARNSASIGPLPSADASHWWSPDAITTAPRLFAFELEVTVQRARWRVGVWAAASAAVGVVIGSLRVGFAGS